MALDFLGNLGPVVSNIGGFLDALGIGKPKMRYGPTPSEAQASSLFQALLDPNNSLVKQNTDINMQRGMQDMLRQLKIMQMQNARGQARGLRPFLFSPERSDEVLNYLLTRGQPAIAEEARNKATGDIRNTAQSLMGFVPYERDRLNAQYANKNRDYSEFKTAGGFGGMFNRFGGGLQNLLKVLMPRPQQDYGEQFGPWQPNQQPYGPGY